MRFRLHAAFSRMLLLGGAVLANSAAAATPAALAARLARNEQILVIDVRSAVAYANGHIPGAMNMPLELLPLKPLPTSLPVIVYGDGLGVIDDSQALAVIRSRRSVNADVLEGGYAAWLAETRLSTVMAGVGPERLPGITYDQLVASGKADMVLVDLRLPAAAVAASAISGRRVAASAAPDIVTEFAAKIGVPLVASNGSVASAVAKAQGASVTAAAAPARAASPAPGGSNSGRLLVLVADSDAAASEAAREMRASGQYRFTILIGGTESIRYEGRVGSGRMDGDVPATRR